MLADFIQTHNLKSLEVEDISALDQCMDVAFAWCDAIGLNRIAIRNQYAKDVWSHHTGISSVADPQPGDFVVWGTQVGPAGHIAIFVDGDKHNFNSFDQNWDTANHHDNKGNPICRVVKHTSLGVLGFLRPDASNLKGESMVDADSMDKLYYMTLGRGPRVDELQYWVGKPLKALIDSVADRDERKAYALKIQAALTQVAGSFQPVTETLYRKDG